MGEKYSHIPIEERELHRWTDISEYLEGKIDLAELHKREYGTDRERATLNTILVNKHLESFLSGLLWGITISMVFAALVALVIVK